MIHQFQVKTRKRKILQLKSSINLAVDDLLLTIETKLISLSNQSNSWANLFAQVDLFERDSFTFELN